MPIEVKMPRLSDTMEMGTIVRWAVKPGQKVAAGDVIADIETDKATMELQTFEEGTVADLSIKEGQQVPVGTVIARLAEAGESVEAVKSSAGAAAQPAGAAPAGAEAARGARNPATGSSQAESDKGPPVGTAAAVAGEARFQDFRAGAGVPAQPPANGQHAAPASDAERVFASPLARKIARERGVDLATIHGSGPSGRIVRKDVETLVGRLSEPAPAPAPGPVGSESRPTTRPAPLPAANAAIQARNVPLSNMRGTIAKRLVQSKTTIPHYQVTVTVRMDALLDLRQQLNDQLASQGVKLSVNDFLVRACALAMHRHPYINSRWNEPAGGGAPSIDFLADVNVGVAIALPVNERGEGGGLVVATIRNADRAGLRHISQETRRLAEKARAKGLSVEDMSDSTFTISNLGMFGVEHFTAIINPPNAAILAVGAAIEKPVIETDPKSGRKQIVIGHEMQMTMSSDHRVIDGAMAAQYLATVKDLLEKPAALLV